MATSRHRFFALDGLRGAAAVAVLLFHCGLTVHCPWMVGHGALAVDVFFAMSGFVVDRAYGARLRAGWPRGAFARARLLRLYPLHLVGLLLGIALLLVRLAWQERPVDIGGLALMALAGALLVPLFPGGDRQVFPLDGPCWSLLVEALANIAFAAVPRWRPGLLAVGVSAAAAVLLAAALGGVPLLKGGTSAHLWVDVARGAFGFGCGLLISRVEGRGWLAGLRGGWAAPAMLALLGSMLVPRGSADAWFDPLAILLLCPAIVALGTAQRQPSDRLRRFCAWAGALSYPLYVLHAPLLELAANLSSPGDGNLTSPRDLALGTAAVLSVALAAIVARWLEPVLLEASRRPGGPVRTPVPTTGASS